MTIYFEETIIVMKMPDRNLAATQKCLQELLKPKFKNADEGIRFPEGNGMFFVRNFFSYRKDLVTLKRESIFLKRNNNYAQFAEKKLLLRSPLTRGECVKRILFHIHAERKRRIYYGMFCSTCGGSRCNNRST